MAQNPINWTEKQLMQPETLAATIKSGKNIPTIISVGPGAMIPGSVDIGSTKEAGNMQKLNAALAKLPKNSKVVVYCGCCPFEHCPNVRPAMATLKELKFTNYYLLNLPKNIKTDWIDKGYPVK
jgi:rhodanese-related sulfurtransferase